MGRICYLRPVWCRKKQGTISFRGIETGKTEVIVWWEGQTDFVNLREVALILFSLVPANSGCERNFSNYSFVHSKLRNRLANDKAKESVYTFGNAKEMRGDSKEKDDISMVDEGSEAGSLNGDEIFSSENDK